MRSLRLACGLLFVGAATGCYVPGGGWTMRTGVDFRTPRKPGCYVEMVDTRWDEWNRVAQMNAYGGSCPPAGAGPLAVESSVYGAPPVHIPAGGGLPAGPAFGPIPTSPEAVPFNPSSGPASDSPPGQPEFPKGLQPPVESRSPESRTPEAGPVTTPAETPPNAGVSSQPVARTDAQAVGGSPSPVARTARTLQDSSGGTGATLDVSERQINSGPSVVGANAGPARTARTREILFDTPLDPERSRVEQVEGVAGNSSPRANAPARRSARRPSVESGTESQRSGQVELSGVVSEESVANDRGTVPSGAGSGAGTATQAEPVQSPAGEPVPPRESRPWWRSGFGLPGR